MIVAANFKTNKTRAQTRDYMDEINSFIRLNKIESEVMGFPPLTALDSFGEGAIVGAQNAYGVEAGAFTGEGGTAPSRFKHVVKQGKRLRRLTPIELEKLNGFPKNHTGLDDNGITDIKRAFFMGNALVVGVIERIGTVLSNRILN